MSKGTLKKHDELAAECMVVSLVNNPRTKLDVVSFEGDGECNFLIRKIRFLHANNVVGAEVKICEHEMRQLLRAVTDYLAARQPEQLQEPIAPREVQMHEILAKR